MMDRDDGLEYLQKLDDWLENDEGGVIPAELLQQRGIAMPSEGDLDDGALHAALWSLIRGMAEIGVFVESTDHLSDRELYRHLATESLVQPTFLSPDDPAFADHLDIIGGCSSDDLRIYLTYYADEEDREGFREDYEGTFPDMLPRPYDRDRHLPTHEERAFGKRAADA